MIRCITLVAIFGLIGAAPQDAAKDDLKKMDGTWTLVSGEEEGQKLSDSTLKTAKAVIKGDKHDVKVGDKTYVGTHKVDPSKKPKTIDAMDTEGTNKGKTSLGIYELKDDEFKVCFAPPGKERPKEFTTKAGSGNILHVWKREKK
jgi:uncharacterized protein (TIGR03067 family)